MTKKKAEIRNWGIATHEKLERIEKWFQDEFGMSINERYYLNKAWMADEGYFFKEKKYNTFTITVPSLYDGRPDDTRPPTWLRMWQKK